MEKLIAELARLYLPAGMAGHETLRRHISGQTTASFDLSDHDGGIRAIVIPFDRQDGEDAEHWTRLCTVANALQADLGFPAPAVSVSGAQGYRLWLSLELAVPAGQAQEFTRLLRQAYTPDVETCGDAVLAPVELPPCLHQATGKWAAFIHPGMGASFTEECGLEMAPSMPGQAGFLEGLQSISAKQFISGLALLRQSQGTAAPPVVQGTQRGAIPEGLLLKDATLEDIVAFLHSKNIEPTFRHVIQR
jgi:hypothetical protein